MNQVLQDYIRDVQKRLGHLPPAIRKRLTSEITGHVILEVASMRREDPELDQEEAARRVIESFCPPEEMLIAYGPDGGVVRSSTGQLILRSKALSEGVDPTRKTFLLNGAAAAGWTLFIGLFAVVAFALLPSLFPDGDLDVQSLEPEVLLDTGYQNLTGNQTLTVDVDREGPFEITVSVENAGGCIELDLRAAGEGPVHGPGCAPQVSVLSDAAGTWHVDLRAQDFSGRVVVTVQPA